MKLMNFVGGNILGVAADAHPSNRFALVKADHDTDNLELQVYATQQKAPLHVETLAMSKQTGCAHVVFQRSNFQSFVVVGTQTANNFVRVMLPEDKDKDDEKLLPNESTQSTEAEISMLSEFVKPEKISGAKRKRQISFDDMLSRFTTVRAIETASSTSKE
jgi:hypothetical protein